MYLTVSDEFFCFIPLIPLLSGSEYVRAFGIQAAKRRGDGGRSRSIIYPAASSPSIAFGRAE